MDGFGFSQICSLRCYFQCVGLWFVVAEYLSFVVAKFMLMAAQLMRNKMIILRMQSLKEVLL